MQPYLFPYIGYFQLIKAVDVFVVYDNIQYTKKGWINRNRILQNGKDAYITFPLIKDSDYLNVVDRKLSPEFDKRKLLNQIKGSYQKAPFFNEVFPIIQSIVNNEENNLFHFILNSIKGLCAYFEIDTPIIVSSSIEINHDLKGQDKVLAICNKLEANQYINAIGGMELYSVDDFKSKGLELKFIKTGEITYSQFNNEFVPFLSIIDVMMFNSKKDIYAMLNNYSLI